MTSEQCTVAIISVAVFYSFVRDMELAAQNVAENSFPANNEPATGAADSATIETSQEMLDELVNGATDSVVSDNTVDKVGDETRCKLNDGVKYEWTDITSDFIGACSSLELGELVHDSKYVASNFNFFVKHKITSVRK